MFWKQISITWILFKTTQSVHVVWVYMSGFMQCCKGLNTKYDKKYWLFARGTIIFIWYFIIVSDLKDVYTCIPSILAACL